MKRAAILLTLFVSAIANAAVGPEHMVLPTNGRGKVLLNDIALNASAATRTFTVDKATGLPAQGYARLVLSVKRTRSAGTDLTMTCTQSPDGGTTDYQLAECESASASGVCTYYQQIWTDAGSASANWTWNVEILGYSHIECTFASTSAGASDKLTVSGAVVTQ